MNLSCKEVSGLIASEGLAEAGWRRRLAARLHLLMCRHCRRYARQLNALGSYARERWGSRADDSPSIERLERAILDRVSGKPEEPPEKSG